MHLIIYLYWAQACNTWVHTTKRRAKNYCWLPGPIRPRSPQAPDRITIPIDCTLRHTLRKKKGEVLRACSTVESNGADMPGKVGAFSRDIPWDLAGAGAGERGWLCCGFCHPQQPHWHLARTCPGIAVPPPSAGGHCSVLVLGVGGVTGHWDSTKVS